MVKSREKKCQNYFRFNTNGMVKYRRVQQEKVMDFDYREEYLKGVDYIKQNIIMVVLREAHSYSVLIRRLIRK